MTTGSSGWKMPCTGYLDHPFVKSEIKEKNNQAF